MVTSHVLMTSTLPTIIGMGVISRSVDTLFGKQARTKTYSGKRYSITHWYTTRKAADKTAALYRKAGHSARVTKLYNRKLKRWGYAVYVR